MNNATRKRLHTALTLPTEFDTDLYDDFVNWVRPEDDQGFHRAARERVIRIIGKGRCLVMFSYPEGYRYRPNDDRALLYLDEGADLVEFHSKPIMAEAERARVGGSTVSWDRVIGEWLVENGARTYTGRGWAERCATDISMMVDLWRWQHSAGVRGE